MNPTNVNKAQANRDPISGAPGAHPVGTGLGAAAGGIAGGAAAGTLAAGPVGTVIGAAVGAVLGGLGGKAIAEHYDPTVEEAYWRGNFEREPYYQRGMARSRYAATVTIVSRASTSPLRFSRSATPGSAASFPRPTATSHTASSGVANYGSRCAIFRTSFQRSPTPSSVAHRTWQRSPTISTKARGF